MSEFASFERTGLEERGEGEQRRGARIWKKAGIHVGHHYGRGGGAARERGGLQGE